MSSKLRNGYYLSTYFSIDKNCNLFDVSIADRHDQNMALWKLHDGEIDLIAYWELERYTGIKHFNKAWHSVAQLKNVINELLRPYDLSLKDVVHIFGTPELDTEISFDHPYGFTYHNLSHLFSAIMLESDLFYNSRILGMALDYGSDYETENPGTLHEFVGCIVDHGNIQLFPIQSPAALWAVAAEANQMGEGSLMALASATSCTITAPPILNRSDFGHIFSKKIWEIYHELIAPIQKMDKQAFIHFSTGYDNAFSLEENKISAVMKIIQDFSIKIMDEQVDEILKMYGLSGEELILAVGGGFCLNCPTNSYLMKKYHFRDFMAAPCINDGGQSLGIGLMSFHQNLGNISFSFGRNPFRAGTLYNSEWLENWKTNPQIKQVSEFCADIAAKDICEDVVVWYESAAEIGPRALGHRSLLGNPSDPRTKDRLNQIKQREFWRPVAPIVMEEEASEYFEEIRPSPYMLHVFRIRPQYCEALSSIAHLDFTARVQTVCKNDIPLRKIYGILQSMKEHTGYPILCNTSLNDRGEPIIESPQRAIEFALEKQINVVYIDGLRVELSPGCVMHSAYRPKISHQIPGASDLAVTANPYRVSLDDICLVFRKYRKDYRLDDPEDAQAIISTADRIRKENKYRREKRL